MSNRSGKIRDDIAEKVRQMKLKQSKWMADRERATGRGDAPLPASVALGEQSLLEQRVPSAASLSTATSMSIHLSDDNAEPHDVGQSSNNAAANENERQKRADESEEKYRLLQTKHRLLSDEIVESEQSLESNAQRLGATLRELREVDERESEARRAMEQLQQELRRLARRRTQLTDRSAEIELQHDQLTTELAQLQRAANALRLDIERARNHYDYNAR